MSDPFVVDFSCICDYAAQESSGKTILAGLYPGMISFEREPVIWPQYFLVASISPRSQNVDFVIEFLDAQSKNIVSFNANYNNTVEPDIKERVLFIAQIPPVKFSGPGVHQFRVRHKKSIIANRDYPVVIGDFLPTQLGTVSMKPKFKLHTIQP